MWRVVPSRSASREEQWRGLLSPTEIMRADRFLVAGDRLTFTVTRGVLRLVLGHYLDLPPREIRFATNQHGKPAVERAEGQPPFRFNLSHSGDRALLAFASGMEIGIDVEQLGSGRNHQALAESLLSPAAFARFRLLTPAEQERAFLQAWTRTEAVTKAAGRGLAVARQIFESVFGSEHPGPVRCATPETPDTTEWFVRAIGPGNDYLAALATPTEHVHVRYCDWL